MASGVIEKVTAFVTRQWEGERQLLLFKHPYAGVQIPAGTVEVGESPEQAALREGPTPVRRMRAHSRSTGQESCDGTLGASLQIRAARARPHRAAGL